MKESVTRTHRKHPIPTTQEPVLHMDILDGQHENETDYILFAQKMEKLHIVSKKQD